MCTDGMNIERISTSSKSWDSMFHYIVELCNLQCDFPPWVLQSCYSKQDTCRHTLQVQLEKAATNTLYLTALDKMLERWHRENHILKLPTFEVCSTSVFPNHVDFVTHLYKSQHDYFHRNVLRLVQSNYSLLIAKLKIKLPEDDSSKRFSSIHKDIVSLPSYVSSSSKYDTFIVTKYVC